MPQKADFLGPYKLQKNTKEGKRKETEFFGTIKGDDQEIQIIE